MTATFTKEINRQLLSFEQAQPIETDPTHLSEYDRLRIDALKQCSYSTYAMPTETSSEPNHHKQEHANLF